MKTTPFTITPLVALLCFVISTAHADDKDKVDWQQAYEKVMQDADTRTAIKTKGLSKDEVIAWLKKKAAADSDQKTIAVKESKDLEKVDWDSAYEKLLKARPEIAKKVENGQATKEDVIEWMKSGGDKDNRKKGKYNGKAIEVKDPRGFQQAGERVVFSGPQPGEQLPNFKVIGLHGKRNGQEYDPVKESGSKPMILIFQDNQVPGQKGLLLNGRVFQQIAGRSAKGLDVYSVFLVDDPTPEKVFEYDFKDEIASIVQMSISKDRRDGPGAFGLNRNLSMTILVARDGKVLHNFPMAQPLLYPNAYVLGAIAEAVEVKPETLAGWLSDDKGDGKSVRDMKMKQQGKKTEVKSKEAKDTKRKTAVDASDVRQ